MPSFDLTRTLKTLQAERVQIHKELTQLDRAIAVIRELAGTEAAPNGHPTKRTVSAAARRKMAKAQKLRWAKFGTSLQLLPFFILYAAKAARVRKWDSEVNMAPKKEPS